MSHTIFKSAALAMLLLLGACGPRSASQGRSGNDAYADSNFEQATSAYRQGIKALPKNDQGTILADLFNNLGAARYQQKKYQSARSAFRKSMAAAQNTDALSRALYNAGNANARMDSSQIALSRYRAALMNTPTNTEAKFNYEFVKRNLPDSQKKKRQQNKPPPDMEPSAYARKIKKKADKLAKSHKYRQAHQLMEQGLRVDQTVRSYQSFIKRLKDIANIEHPPPKPTKPRTKPDDASTPSAHV